MIHFRSAATLTTLAVIWFAAGTSPARAQLVVSAPTPACAHTLETWYAQHVPVHFQAHARVTLRVLTDAEMDAYLGQGTTSNDSGNARSGDADDGLIDGEFENQSDEAPPEITLRLPPDGDVDVFTFAHEYGHYLWFDVFSKDDRKRYEALYSKQKTARHLVTRYAATDVEEGFAEAFSFYAAAPPLLARRDPASYQFLSHMADVH